MKDKQIAPASAEPRIFLVSAFLHCVSMTALVYLRSSFGFGYLRPKSVFFALSWTFGLYALYAWLELAKALAVHARQPEFDILRERSQPARIQHLAA